jgi:hypothetical protein
VKNNLICRFKAGFALALAVCMALVYPVHVIVDHSGLFGHHEHSHHHEDDGSHPANPIPDEELCALCLTLSSMETSESIHPAPYLEKEPVLAHRMFTGNEITLDLSLARAPPNGLLIFSSTMLHKKNQRIYYEEFNYNMYSSGVAVFRCRHS